MNKMKIIFKILIVHLVIACCLLGALLLSPTKSMADNPHRAAECILVQFRGAYRFIPNVGNEQTNLVVSWSSQSSGVTPPPPGTPLGETVAALISAGFKIQSVLVDRYLFVKE